MHHNYCLTRKLCSYSYTNAPITGMHIVICLRLRQLKQLPKLFELFVKQNSNTFLIDLKQFSEIMIVCKHKRV